MLNTSLKLARNHHWLTFCFERHTLAGTNFETIEGYKVILSE